MVAPVPGFATGVKLTLSKRFSRSNRTSTLVRLVIGNRFVTPTELQHYLEDAGLSVTRVQGVEFDPLRWDWRLSSDTDVNYMVVAEKL